MREQKQASLGYTLGVIGNAALALFIMPVLGYDGAVKWLGQEIAKMEHPDAGDQTSEFTSNSTAWQRFETSAGTTALPRTMREYDERQPLATWQRLAALEAQQKRLVEAVGQLLAMKTIMLNDQQFLQMDVKHLQEVLLNHWAHIMEAKEQIAEHAGGIKHVAESLGVPANVASEPRQPA